MDRAKLEEAIGKALDWSLNEDGAAMERFFGAEELSRLCRGAQAYLATLPKTKMAEVWRVEYANSDGDALVVNRTDHAIALTLAGNMQKDSQWSCIRVTGPHQQEVPA